MKDGALAGCRSEAPGHATPQKEGVGCEIQVHSRTAHGIVYDLAQSLWEKGRNELSKAPVSSNPVIYFRRWSYSVPKSIGDGSTEPGTSNESCGGKYET